MINPLQGGFVIETWRNIYKKRNHLFSQTYFRTFQLCKDFKIPKIYHYERQIMQPPPAPFHKLLFSLARSISHNFSFDIFCISWNSPKKKILFWMRPFSTLYSTVLHNLYSVLLCSCRPCFLCPKCLFHKKSVCNQK